MDGVGVDEGDLEAEETAPRPLVDQQGAFGTQLLERRTDVGHLEGHVVHTRPALGQELPDRGLLAERGEQLDPALADAKRSSLDTLVGNGLALLELGAEEQLVGRKRLVEVIDSDTEVVDPARLHAADAI